MKKMKKILLWGFGLVIFAVVFAAATEFPIWVYALAGATYTIWFWVVYECGRNSA